MSRHARCTGPGTARHGLTGNVPTSSRAGTRFRFTSAGGLVPPRPGRGTRSEPAYVAVQSQLSRAQCGNSSHLVPSTGRQPPLYLGPSSRPHKGRDGPRWSRVGGNLRPAVLWARRGFRSPLTVSSPPPGNFSGAGTLPLFRQSMRAAASALTSQGARPWQRGREWSAGRGTRPRAERSQRRPGVLYVKRGSTSRRARAWV